MSLPGPQLTDAATPVVDAGAPEVLGSTLMNLGLISAADLLHARGVHKVTAAPLSRILIAEGMATENQVMAAQSIAYGIPQIDLVERPPDPVLMDKFDPVFCRDNGIVPWQSENGALTIATARPEEFETLRSVLGDQNLSMVLATERAVQRVLTNHHRTAYLQIAENWVDESESAREICAPSPRRKWALTTAAFAVLLIAITYPNVGFAFLAGWALITLICSAAMKISATFAARRPSSAAPEPDHSDLPVVSIMVPLFRERDIAGALVRRLGRLSYPRALLDIVLVLEEDDIQTRSVLEQAVLPPWFRIVDVPRGHFKTKPRALNYALRFCRGQIVGIYDAEDAPAPDQIYRVVAAFQTGPPELACVQGVLDFYNPHSTWLARCFTVEYAAWFRVVLSGLAQLGFAIPLGGTTVFFRRSALERVKGWDAQNVTEDADLGFRLARYGYRTELVHTVTREEACNRFWPWVRQRSRWLKGYMVTYLVHMRRPLRLFRQLGPRKFLGFQVLFVSALSQFLLAPVLWSFWLVPFGLPHPMQALVSDTALLALGALFLAVTVLDMLVGIYAISLTQHQRIGHWVPTLMFYFPIGALAAYKAVWEMFGNPFYWDKTSHGHASPTTD